VRIAVAVLLCACGRVGFDPITARASDGGVPDGTTSPDVAQACTQFGPFGTPQTFAAVNSVNTDWGPHMSNDGLELVFASNRAGIDQLYTSTRATATDPWPAAVLTKPPNGTVDDPELSADRLSLYYGGGGVHLATRATTESVWVDQGLQTISTTGFSVDGGPWLSGDELHLVFTGTGTADNVWHEYEALRTSTTDPFGVATAVPLAHTAAGEAYGSLRGDEREIVFETQSTGQLQHATRTSATEMFGAASSLDELNMTGFSFGDPDLSADGTTLWFASTRPGGLGDYDLWLTTRTCL
jgi:hypothetical protein